MTGILSTLAGAFLGGSPLGNAVSTASSLAQAPAKLATDVVGQLAQAVIPSGINY
ncbi:hypothetical protein BH09PSE5_BH09PSE5_48910 [soil metagenome]